MQPEVLTDILKERFAEAVIGTNLTGCHPWVQIVPEQWPAIAVFLRDDSRCRFNVLRCVSGVDYPADDAIEVVYDLIAMHGSGADGLWENGGMMAVKIRVPRDGGHIPSVARIWPAADWHEREVFDLLGVRFDGHPDPRRILLPDDWVGHPLRKDYEFPRE